MKQLILSLLIGTQALISHAQTIDVRKKIDVVGTAETEVTPDIIYLNISLKEYVTNNGKKKVEIEELEHQLQTAVLGAGIPKEDLMINNIASYNWDWTGKKNLDFLARKQYRIKVADLSKVNQLISAIDPKGIEYSGIDGYDYSKIETLKKDLKIKALQNAKEKANYLLEAIGEKLGGPIDIQEINDEYYPTPRYRAVTMNAMAADATSASMPDIDFKKIKLKYQMHTIFEVK